MLRQEKSKARMAKDMLSKMNWYTTRNWEIDNSYEQPCVRRSNKILKTEILIFRLGEKCFCASFTMLGDEGIVYGRNRTTAFMAYCDLITRSTMMEECLRLEVL